MAKKFGGFTPEQMGKIIPEMQGMQADEQARFLASQPGAAARVGKMAEVAQKRIGMAYGGMVKKGYAIGGMADLGGTGAMVAKMAEEAERFRKDNNIPVGGYDAQIPEVGSFNDSYGQLPLEPIQNTLTTNISGEMYDESDPKNYGAFGPMLQNDSYNTVLQDAPVVFNEADGRIKSDIRQENFDRSFTPDLIEEVRTPDMLPYEEETAAPKPMDVARTNLAASSTALQAAIKAQQADPGNKELADAVTAAQTAYTSKQQEYGAAEKTYNILNTKGTKEIMNTAFDDPESLVTKADVQKIKTDDTQVIDPKTGQVATTADTATVTEAAAATAVEAPTTKDAVSVTAETTAAAVQDTISKITAATGKPSADALVDAAQMSPDELAQLGLTVAQIAEAQKVVAPAPRKVETGELIEGSTVDMGRVKKETNFEAVTGAPSTDATVQGQLTGLMEQFEGNEPPAWAAGAMRQAAAMMATRGLSASSMAGQAAIQAAMESALPIAQMDSQTVAKFEMQNLSNKQQAAMFAAEKRAEFLGLEFTQDFQSRVTNAAKISDIANINFTAEQQIALENARMAQTVDITNLNATNAKVMADAAAMTQTDLSNLNNRQQARVQNAKSFLEIDMTNLTNEQQTNMFKSQSLISSIFNDQAAVNAAAQFNASSEMQMTQFYDNMSNTVAMFNEEQANSIELFNAGESNAVEQFNKSLINQREQFNASNSLIIEQANAAWYQSVATSDTAAQNLANIQVAKDASELTSLGFSAMIQEVRDMMSYAWQTENNNADRAGTMAVATLQAAEARAASEVEAGATKSSGFWGAVGTFAAAWIKE